MAQNWALRGGWRFSGGKAAGQREQHGGASEDSRSGEWVEWLAVVGCLLVMRAIRSLHWALRASPRTSAWRQVGAGPPRGLPLPRGPKAQHHCLAWCENED